MIKLPTAVHSVRYPPHCRGVDFAGAVQTTTIEKHLSVVRGFLGWVHATYDVPLNELDLTAFADPDILVGFLAFLQARGVSKAQLAKNIGVARKVLAFLQSGQWGGALNWGSSNNRSSNNSMHDDECMMGACLHASSSSTAAAAISVSNRPTTKLLFSLSGTRGARGRLRAQARRQTGAMAQDAWPAAGCNGPCP